MQKQKIVQKIDPDILQFLKGRKEVPVNTMIILINIVVFFLTELTGSSLDGKHLVQWGAAYTPLIQEGHEYYRFFVCFCILVWRTWATTCWFYSFWEIVWNGR